MSGNQIEQNLADHLMRYEFRKRVDEARIVETAKIAMAAAAYTMKLARRLGHDDLADELNAEVNEYMQSIAEQQQAIASDFEETGLGPIDRWYAPDSEDSDA